jgi:very-short-patch-repair endonuclease
MCPDKGDFARTLRKRSTDAENTLWKSLRAKRLQGLKFRRQEPIGKYIVDFVCYEKKIIIEIDGGQHSVDKEKDQERDHWFKTKGFEVLRFWNNDVLKKTEEILEIIMKRCLESPSPLSPPIKGGDIQEKS